LAGPLRVSASTRPAIPSPDFAGTRPSVWRGVPNRSPFRRNPVDDDLFSARGDDVEIGHDLVSLQEVLEGSCGLAIVTPRISTLAFAMSR